MKTICTLTVLLLALCLLGCSPAGSASLPLPELNSTPVVVAAHVDWEDRDITFDQYVERYRNIVLAKVNVAAVERINAAEYGIVTGVAEDWKNVTCYDVEVTESLKGDYVPGDTLRIDQYGRNVGNITEYTEGCPFLKVGSTYLIFIDEPPMLAGCEYFSKSLSDPLDGYAEVVNGALIRQNLQSRFYYSGITYGEVKGMIAEAVANAD